MDAHDCNPARRRQWLARAAAVAATLAAKTAWGAGEGARPAAPAPLPSPEVHPGEVLRFPRDFGAHPAVRTEWWYLTGSLRPARQTPGDVPGDAPGQAPKLGFQLTFFRSRVDAARASHSPFAAHQLIFAHTALSDIGAGRQWHDQRIARSGFGLAQAGTADTDVALRDWTLRREGLVTHSHYLAHVDARDFGLDLRCTQTQPLLLQGEQGYSRKGPGPAQASHYYTQPQLAVTGTLRRQGRSQAVQGLAWLDHEWGGAFLGTGTVGWDWIGMNLRDGSALTAFRLRGADGRVVWAGGSLRRPGETVRNLAPHQVRFTPGRTWRSPATNAAYPVEWRVDIDGTRYQVRALMDNQELDSRQSTGSVYWEGLSELSDPQGQVLGSGYLEMTGYVAPMAL